MTPGRRAAAEVASRPPVAEWANAANALTLLRVALLPVIAWLLTVEGDAARWWAFGIFVFAALTDSIDGWVARRWLGETRWGKLADPVADKVLIIGSLGVLAYLGELPWPAVAVIAVREVAVTVQRSVLVRGGVVMGAGLGGKVKTITQIAAVTFYLAPPVPGPVADVALWLAVAATVVSGAQYALRHRQVARG